MSFIHEVLSSAEKVELNQINTKVEKLTSDVKICKEEVHLFLDNVYVKLLERPQQNKVLYKKLSAVQDELTIARQQIIQVRMSELKNTKDKVENHLNDLNTTIHAISTVRIFYNIHEALIELSELQNDNNFIECIDKIKEIEEYLNSIKTNETSLLVQQLNVLFSVQKQSVLNKLSNAFKDLIDFKSDNLNAVMEVKREGDKFCALEALYSYYKTYILQLHDLTKNLWDHILVPIVDSTVTIQVKITETSALLQVTISANDKRMSYMEVFANIKVVLEFLTTYFKYPLSCDLNTLEYIGRDIRDNLSELIIKRCLQDTIPSTEDDLKRYNVVIDEVDSLEKSLVASGIFADDTSSILNYANNIDVLFINKKCQNYVMQAQNLMKKDLHDTVEVGEAYDNKSLEIPTSFPKCLISKSVLEILGLGEKIVNDACRASDVCAGRLFCTVENILKMYSTFVPDFHKKLLQTIPQQIALFYNNCLYISHVLTEWSDTYSHELPAVLDIGPNMFTTQGKHLKQVALKTFTNFVDGQIKQIDEIIRGACLGGTLEQLPVTTEKCLRQCLRQQELLKTVWQKVLPYSIYNQTLGMILNSLCCNLINSTVKFEDISSSAGEQLVELLKMVTIRGPKLFTDSNEVALFVKCWYKLNELIFVLNANLFDINDRWADGKGPLAHHFEPHELKQLIRALFQNTERRAALLSKIKI